MQAQCCCLAVRRRGVEESVLPLGRPCGPGWGCGSGRGTGARVSGAGVWEMGGGGGERTGAREIGVESARVCCDAISLCPVRYLQITTQSHKFLYHIFKIFKHRIDI